MGREKVSAAALAIVLSWSAMGCSKKEPAPAEVTPTATPTPPPVAVAAPPDPATEAKAVFDRKCVVCHGDHGAGDGPGAAALEPKPRAFADAAWQASVTDEHIKKIIVEGGAAVGKSPGMPATPELKGKDDVLSALVKHIRDFKK
jgi:mono/diheme cytochrome c family protein